MLSLEADWLQNSRIGSEKLRPEFSRDVSLLSHASWFQRVRTKLKESKSIKRARAFKGARVYPKILSYLDVYHYKTILIIMKIRHSQRLGFKANQKGELHARFNRLLTPSVGTVLIIL